MKRIYSVFFIIVSLVFATGCDGSQIKENLDKSLGTLHTPKESPPENDSSRVVLPDHMDPNEIDYSALDPDYKTVDISEKAINITSKVSPNIQVPDVANRELQAVISVAEDFLKQIPLDINDKSELEPILDDSSKDVLFSEFFRFEDLEFKKINYHSYIPDPATDTSKRRRVYNLIYSGTVLKERTSELGNMFRVYIAIENINGIWEIDYIGLR